MAQSGLGLCLYPGWCLVPGAAPGAPMFCSWPGWWNGPGLPGPALTPWGTPCHGQLQAVVAPWCFLLVLFPTCTCLAFLNKMWNATWCFFCTRKVNLTFIWECSFLTYMQRDFPIRQKNAFSCRAGPRINLLICTKCINGSFKNSLSVHPHAGTPAQLIPPHTFFTSVLFNLCWVFS